MKRLFFYLSLLLLSSPTHASHTFDETTFARGFTIYQSLSYQWMESRERIAKQGLNPFIEDVKEWMGAIAIMQPDVKERLPAIAETIKKTAPDIHKMLNTMLNNNQKAYKRPPLLSSLDVSKAGILFQALGQHYENTDAFIEEIVQNDLPRAVSYKIFNEWCESIDPSLKMFFDTYIFNPFIPQEKRPIHAMACQLMWYEPHQIFFHAINKRFEDIFKNATQDIEKSRNLPLTSYLNNGLAPHPSASTNRALSITYAASNLH